jgi:hypothetical protein
LRAVIFPNGKSALPVLSRYKSQKLYEFVIDVCLYAIFSPQSNETHARDLATNVLGDPSSEKAA